MLHLRNALDATDYKGYYVDIEYNRNKDGKLKEIVAGHPTPISICCDLIVHSRGEIAARTT